tara:strand:- start:289 stop:489 length:201 start_codon:yes stop_codon:yes gene_type:complete
LIDQSSRAQQKGWQGSSFTGWTNKQKVPRDQVRDFISHRADGRPYRPILNDGNVAGFETATMKGRG